MVDAVEPEVEPSDFPPEPLRQPDHEDNGDPMPTAAREEFEEFDERAKLAAADLDKTQNEGKVDRIGRATTGMAKVDRGGDDRRPVVTLYLPMPASAAGSILLEVAQHFPDAVMADDGDHTILHVFPNPKES